jgi:hypothetical protein
MNDLHDFLERVSKPRHDWVADSGALLHEGRRRVRRRRLAGGAMTSVAVLALGGVAISQLGGSSSKAVGPSGPATYANLNLTPLSNAEVKKRCVSVLKLDAGNAPTDFVVPNKIMHENPGIPPDGHNHQTPKPWHDGTDVLVMPRTRKEWLHYGAPHGCAIPEAGRTPQPFTRVSTVAQLRGDCEDNLGIDLGGWQQLAASSDGTVAGALFRSGNGYLVHCFVERSDGVQGGAGVFRESAFTSRRHPPYVHAVCNQMSVAKVPIECIGDGRIDDHTAAQVDVTLPSGRVVRTDAHDGYWSVTVRDDASGKWWSKTGATFKATPAP